MVELLLPDSESSESQFHHTAMHQITYRSSQGNNPKEFRCLGPKAVYIYMAINLCDLLVLLETR